MRLWLVRKLASLTSEPNALLSQFKNLYERESADEEARVEAVQCDSASADFVEHWERTESQKKRINRDVGPAAHVMLDPASGKSLLLRLLPLQYASDVEHVVSIAENLRDLRCHGIIRIVSVHSHEFTSFNLHGTCSQVWTLVAFVTSNIGSRCLTDQIDGCRQAISASAVQNWAHQIAVALAALHHGNLLHQNIHPHAICLDEEGRAVLDDFLFMTDARPPGRTYSRGRSDYGAIAQELVAPEINQQSGALSPKADIWAFGCCIYRWITGVMPRVSVLSHPKSQQWLAEIPRQFRGPLYHAIGLALQSHPPTRATASDLVRVLERQ